MTTIRKIETRIEELDEKLADERRMTLSRSDRAIKVWEGERVMCFKILKDLALEV